jgi:hypothetical protein
LLLGPCRQITPGPGAWPVKFSSFPDARTCSMRGETI